METNPPAFLKEARIGAELSTAKGEFPNEKTAMKAMRLTHPRKHSYKTLWFGLAGTVVVIVGSILFGYAQGQKHEAEKMNPTKPVPNDAELREK